MTERELFDALLWGWFGLSAAAFVALQYLSAPYGRHARGGWGPMVPSAGAWMVMELPAVALPVWLYTTGDRVGDPVATVFLAMWLLHYLHRTFVWPLRMRLRGKTMPLSIPVLAFTTNLGIDWLNARWLFGLGPARDASWLWSPQFLVGAALFFVGMAINRHSDEILRNLRQPGETGYRVPHGGAYRWVSCPNYLGEIIEWAGWAIATWSLPGLAFLVWTLSNLVPRALQHHRWYQEKFPEYPPERRALVPGLM